MTTLREAMELLGAQTSKAKKNIAAVLLGKYQGILPRGKTSANFIKSQRLSLYDKVK